MIYRSYVFCDVFYVDSGSDKNYEFCRYKLGKFSKNYRRDNIEFPKTLSLEFASSLVPKRDNSTMTRSSRPSSESAVNEGGRLSSTIYFSEAETRLLSSLASNQQQMSSAYQLGGYKDENGDGKGSNLFQRVCALCYQRHPVIAEEHKVLWKHVVTLRRSWNPNLVSDEIKLLDNTISMYNLVPVCSFCVQYFDPDFDGGIAYPNREAKEVPYMLLSF